jgi:hypothetical protein
VPRVSVGRAWIRLSLRGERRLDAKAELFFRYRAQGADRVEVELFHSKSGMAVDRRTVELTNGSWGEVTVTFDPRAGGSSPRVVPVADEIRFLLPAGAELLVDDVLLYTPDAAPTR